jgi:L-fuconolactonase
VGNVLLDAHVHLLQTDIDYPWMVDELARSLKTHLKVELDLEFSSHNVIGGVAVQAIGDVRETQMLLALATKSPTIIGVVGWIDLASPSYAEDLATLVESPGGERLVGVRHQTHDEDDPKWLLRSDVLRGLEHLASVGLAFDLLIRPRELTAACALASALPHLTLVVDHVAKPVVSPPTMAGWRDELALLASNPNVFCKLSGLVTESVPLGEWTSEQLEPFFAAALDIFEPTRCMFGSDWPVCRLAASYTQVVELATSALATLSSSQRHDVLCGSAVRAYKLKLPDAYIGD